MGSNTPLLGRTLGGRYKLTAHIGEGAMASVFRGTDVQAAPGANGDVAVKIMHPHLAMDPSFTARFKREAKSASMVKHANSVAILDIGEEGGVHFLVMELCVGRDLREILKVERRLIEPRAAKIVMAICEALTQAHSIGIVHRDLKPENVMVSRDQATGVDRVKVLDFGIAKLVDNQPKIKINADSTDSEPPPALTQFGVVMGTPQYMSPEQCRGQPLDGRSDVYTCGILLYQLVTGTIPFDSESPLEIAGKQAFEEPAAPRTRLPTVDPEMESLIMRTLSKSPNDRPQSADDLRKALQAFVDRVAGGQQPSTMLSAGDPFRAVSKTSPVQAAAGSVQDYLQQHGGGPPAPQFGGPPPGAGGPFQPTQNPLQPPGPFQPPGGGPTNGGAFQPPPFAPPADPFAQGAANNPASFGLAPPPPAAQLAAAPAQAPPVEKSGWGVVGWLMVFVSAGAGVGIGFALYTFL